MKKRKPTRAEATQFAVKMRRAALAAAQNAIEAHNNSARLAQVIAFLSAKAGEPIVISASELAALPDEAKLNERYDPESDSYAFTCVRPKQEQKIKIVQSGRQVGKTAATEALLNER